ncbi:hypothetical protein QOZ80_9BG0710160 [Eleusine coracana subsp. coracana]|nr:hypothetical protein QOZ80_9BG0710160 [Eleusine coracana subsp. coracana]
MEQFALADSYYYALFCLLLALVVLHLHAKLGAGRTKPHQRLPPGPSQLPLIGSLHHLLRGLPHHTIRDLSACHGPVMLLRVCERAVVVVSSAEAAREVFTGHGTAFEQLPSSPGIDEMSRHGTGILFAPYGEQWRLLRRVHVTEARSSLARAASRSSARLADFVADSSVRAIFGDRLPDRSAFLSMVKRGVEFSSLFDLRDLFPSSRLVRMLSRSRKAERHRQEMFRLVDDILRHHEEKKMMAGDGERDQDMVDVLLRIQKDGSMRVSLTSGVIRAVLTDVFGAALDTSTSTLQLAMAELMVNPRVMEKTQLEVRRVLAGQDRVREAALRSMPYLKAVVKETLRLHPPGPFVPRACINGQMIQGYDVPKGTILVVNVWAISRDPRHWDKPDKFMPERFEGERALDFKGLDFEYTPFGAGRRICPGTTLAQVNVEIALASLLYHFDWELPAGAKPEDIDMTEQFGVTVSRKSELCLHPIPRIPTSTTEHL